MEARRRRASREDRTADALSADATVTPGEAQRAAAALRSWLIPAHASASARQCGWPADSVPLLSVGVHVKWVEPGHDVRVPRQAEDGDGGGTSSAASGFQTTIMPPWHSRGLRLAAVTFPSLEEAKARACFVLALTWHAPLGTGARMFTPTEVVGQWHDMLAAERERKSFIPPILDTRWSAEAEQMAQKKKAMQELATRSRKDRAVVLSGLGLSPSKASTGWGNQTGMRSFAALQPVPPGSGSRSMSHSMNGVRIRTRKATNSESGDDVRGNTVLGAGSVSLAIVGGRNEAFATLGSSGPARHRPGPGPGPGPDRPASAVRVLYPELRGSSRPSTTPVGRRLRPESKSSSRGSL